MFQSKKLFFLVVFILNTAAVQAVTMTEMYVMLKRTWQNSKDVGGVAPLSRFVCQEIVSQMPQEESLDGRHYLEVGAGCGTTTEYIVQNLKDNDHLVLIEVDIEMCEFLKHRYQDKHNVTVCCCSITEWKSDQKYDAIISTLPFNSFDVQFAQQTMNVFHQVAKPDCVVTYVECPIVKQICKYFFSKKKRQKFEKVQSFLQVIRENHLIASKTIYTNIPPIEVHHLSF